MMMLNIKNEKIPLHFAACLCADCEQSATCLRSRVYEACEADCEKILVLNPMRCAPGAACPYWRSAAPVRYAYGLLNMQEHMQPRQYAAFRKALCGEYGVHGFYRRRCGAVALTPGEQTAIRNLLKNIGVDESLDFDDYKELLSWE